MTDKLTTWQVLRNKFLESEYVLLSEVSDASGFSRSRSLDFMIINLWQSRGLSVTGIERKSNRADWLKELKNPAKQENHFKHCDYFYLLTDKEGVARLDEIPDSWGWYHINQSQILKTMKAAPKLTPLPIERSLMCAMLRRAAAKEKYVHVDTLETHIAAKAEELQKERNTTLKYKADGYDNLKRIIDEFYEASGINLHHGRGDIPKNTGEAVKLIMNSGLETYTNGLERIEAQVKHIHQAISEKIKVVKGFEKLNTIEKNNQT